MKHYFPQLRFAIPVVAFILLALVGTYQFYTRVQYANAYVENNMSARAMYKGMQASYTLENSIRSDALGSAEITFSWFGEDPDLNIALLVDHNNSVILSTRYELKGQSLSETPFGGATGLIEKTRDLLSIQKIISDDRLTSMSVFPINFGAKTGELRPRQIGVLYLEYGLANSKNNEYSQRLQQFYYFMAVLGVICLCLWGFFEWALTSRIRHLAAASRSMMQGEYQTRVNLRGRDELASLGKTFNLMAQGVEEKNRVIAESEERYRFLVEQPGQMSYDYDVSTRNIQWYGDIEGVTGFDIDEFQKLDISAWEEMIHPDDRKIVLKQLDESKRNASEYHIEYRFRLKDGKYCFIEDIGFFQTDERGAAYRMLGLLRDITERKKAEEQLRKLSQAVEQSPSTVIITDTDGKIEYINPKFTQLTGYTFEEAVGKTPRILKSGKTPPEEYKQLWETITSGREWYGEFCNKKKNGELYWESTSISPIRNTEGVITHFIAVKEDITERKKAEGELRKLKDELDIKVTERTKELEAFSYAVSHDLRSPLRSIDGFSKILLRELADGLNDRGKDCLQRVCKASQKMAHLIDDLLTLSRLSRHGMKYGTVNLSRLAGSIARELKETEPERQVDFDIKEGVVAYGDAELLSIALENLLRNAWKFTGKHPSAKIEFGVTHVNGEEVYFVRDDGVGFDIVYVDKIFGEFQRLHSENEFPGTGIGLATVRRIINRHGGRIWAEGEVDKGATLYFTIPESKKQKEMAA